MSNRVAGQLKFKLFPVECLVLLAMATGCSDGSGGPGAPAEGGDVTPAAPFQELYDQGVDRYLGLFSPMKSEALEGGETRHSFGGDDGPLCFTGNEFFMSTRDGVSSDLLIFVQGGGACGPTSCDAIQVGIPFFNAGLLNRDDPANPAADYNVGYIPYCDGTFHTGDRNVDSDGDGINDRFFRGLQNLSASLDVIVSAYPAPSRILLAGNSAGGWGTHFALPLVRKLYPEVPIELVNDSGIGISQPGVQETLTEYWNSGAFYPASCPDCIGEDGNITEYHKYQLAEDSNLRMGFISSTQDEVVVDSLMIDGEIFEAELRQAMTDIEEAYPDRFRSLINEGTEHTFILRRFDFRISDTTVRQWLSDMLEGGDNWVSVSE